MTRQDFILKWLFYALALLPVWWMDTFVLGRFPVLGVAPMLLPVAAVAVAVLEGALAGAGFGLGTAVALLLLGALVYLLVRKNPYDENHLTQRIKVGA